MIYRNVPLGGETRASLDCYELDSAISTGKTKRHPTIVLLPGGGYTKQATREGEPVAMRFLGLGYNVCILRYSTYMLTVPLDPGDPFEANPSSHYPVQLVELMRTMRYVRTRAREIGADENRIYVMGFSAGAHVAVSFAERFDDAHLLAQAGLGPKEGPSLLPAGLVCGYPMLESLPTKRGNHPGAEELPEGFARILDLSLFGHDHPTEEEVARMDLVDQVRPEMPRTFCWQTSQDELTSPADTALFVSNLLAVGVPCEFHLFQDGGHGMALAEETTSVAGENVDPIAAQWVPLAHAWMSKDR